MEETFERSIEFDLWCLDLATMEMNTPFQLTALFWKFLKISRYKFLTMDFDSAPQVQFTS